MPCFRTSYQTKGLNRSREIRGFIYAKDKEQAEEFSKLRNLNEQIFEEIPDTLVPYTRPSEQLMKFPKLNQQESYELLHGVLWLSFLWAKYNNNITHNDTVGDDGIVHDVIHCLDLMYPKDRVIKLLQKIEKDIPGYLDANI